MSEHKQEAGQEGHGGGAHGHGGGHGRAHGGGHEEAHEGAPEWLISFADNVTLMMGFFVILLAMNMAKPAMSAGAGGPSDGAGGEVSPALLDMAIAIREAFNNPVDVNSNNPREAALVRRVLERAREGFSRADGVEGRQHDTQSIRPGDYRKAAGSVAFDAGSSVLSVAAKAHAARIARHFRGVRTILEVRGHVSAAEATHSADHGMRLSYERAAAVAGVLAENGIDWRQLRIVACGDNDRLKGVAYGAEDQHTNERAEVIPTDLIMPVYVPDPQPAAGKP